MLEIIHSDHTDTESCTCISGREGCKLLLAESTGDMRKIQSSLLETLTIADAYDRAGEGWDVVMALHFPDNSGIILGYGAYGGDLKGHVNG
jgi:hypothetical protein